MKFDSLVNSILNEDESLDQWHKAQMDKEAALDKKEAYKSNLLRRDEEPIDDFVEFVKSIPGSQLEKIFREDLYTYYTSIEGTSNEDESQDRIEIIANELLKKGFMPEDIETIHRQVHAEVKGTSDK